MFRRIIFKNPDLPDGIVTGHIGRDLWWELIGLSDAR